MDGDGEKEMEPQLGTARLGDRRLTDGKRVGLKTVASSASSASSGVDRALAAAMTPIRALKDRRDSESDGGSVWTRVSAPMLGSPGPAKMFSSWSARAWCIADETTGKVLLSHNADMCLQVRRRRPTGPGCEFARCVCQ